MRTTLLTIFIVFLTTVCRGQSTLSQRLRFISVTASENTGQNYAPWLSDDLNNLVQPVNGANLKWTQVTLKLEKKSLISSLQLYCRDNKFANNPAVIYALNGTQRIKIGTYKGGKKEEWVTLTPFQPLVADAIMVYKYGNDIPQKINAYGQIITRTTVIPRPLEPLQLASATDLPVTGQNYSNYLNDNLKKLVPPYLHPNNARWTDVIILFEKPSLLLKLDLYDGDDSFVNTPAEIYALNGGEKTLIGTFTGESFRMFKAYNLTESRVAEGLVIHKYQNAIPLKIKAYGLGLPDDLLELPVIPPTSTTVSTAVLGIRIPVNARKWYQLNNTSEGLDALFDGAVVADVFTGWGKVLETYDAYYPLLPNEAITIKGIRFFDGSDSRPTQPLRLSIITHDWQRIEIAQFKGLAYQSWVGPYPDRPWSGTATNDPAQFLLDTPISGARFLVVNTADFWPTEMELYGTYVPGDPTTPAVPAKAPLFKNLLGVNGFEWDFYVPNQITIAEPKMAALKSFGVMRHYMDWEKIEIFQGNYTFNPTHSGGWNYDLMYERAKAEGIEVMTCFKNIAPFLRNTYPLVLQQEDLNPVHFNTDPTLPQSYSAQARAAFQYAARYGKNTLVDPALVSVNTAPRWTNDPPNQVKIGLGLINSIECENERDKWWGGRLAYQTGREYAANMSAFYDGHKNTMGPGAGVKNADPSMVVVMGGLASASGGTDYIRGMIDWCREFRGMKADGGVNLCWDVINYHLYPDNANSMQSGSSTRGSAPELSVAADVVRTVRKLAAESCAGMPVYVSETGYDLNPGSPLKAIGIGSKSALETQADWNLRTALLYAREGVERVDFYQTYDLDLNSGTRFASMGFLNGDYSRKPTADYFYQAKRLLGNYTFKESLSTNPNVDRYERDGESVYALWIPDEVGRTGQYTLDLNKAGAAHVFSLQVGRDTMAVQAVAANKGKIVLTLTETPIFVKGISRQNRVATEAETDDWTKTVAIFPNPATDVMTVGWTASFTGPVSVRVLDATLGLTHRTWSMEKNSPVFRTTLDVSALPYGLHLLEIQQGSERVIRRILKVR